MTQDRCDACKCFSRTFYNEGKGGICDRFPKWELVNEDHRCREFSTKDIESEISETAVDELALDLKDLICQLASTIKNPPRHVFWGAGEADCPKEIKASNGELHTLRCKKCGLENATSQPCLGDISPFLRTVIENAVMHVREVEQ